MVVWVRVWGVHLSRLLLVIGPYLLLRRVALCCVLELDKSGGGLDPGLGRFSFRARVALGLYWECIGIVLGLERGSTGAGLGLSWCCPGIAPGAVWHCTGAAMGLHLDCTGLALGLRQSQDL